MAWAWRASKICATRSARKASSAATTMAPAQRGPADVAPGHAEHVAEQQVAEVQRGRHAGVEHEAEAEQAGEHHAHRGVLLDPAVVLEPAGARGADEAGDERADRDGQAGDEGEDHPGQHRVADRVAHQRPAAQDQEARQHRHRQRGGDGDGEGHLHERQLEREQGVSHGAAAAPGPRASRVSARRRRRAGTARSSAR